MVLLLETDPWHAVGFDLPQAELLRSETRSRQLRRLGPDLLDPECDLDVALRRLAAAADLVAPLLIVFGRQDRLIPWQQAARLYDAVPEPKQLLMLEDGNHGCANVAPQHRPRTADWLAARLLGAPEPTIPSPDTTKAG